ncbi:uncharacterized protein [Diabrotica undecimpunctata]|uniref:uncharacterized protein isoform X1 n=1 Tax=Diabrotica undecimpunctata TaxID=50387 RepID=UPI003B641E17
MEQLNIEISRINLNKVTRLQRIIFESFEIIQHCCNTVVLNCGPLLVADMFQQILPTAFYLSTGYWPLYDSMNDRIPCICEFINVECIHDHSITPCFNIFQDVPEYILFKGRNNQIQMVNVILTIMEEVKSQIIVIRYQVKHIYDYKQYCDEVTVDPVFYSAFRCSMRPVRQVDDFFLFFELHPCSMPLYGAYFRDLKDFKLSQPPKYYIVSRCYCPEEVLYIDQMVTGTINFDDDYNIELSNLTYNKVDVNKQLKCILSTLEQTTECSSWKPVQIKKY